MLLRQEFLLTETTESHRQPSLRSRFDLCSGDRGSAERRDRREQLVHRRKFAEPGSRIPGKQF
jgi:hypothetical protein